MGLKGRLVFSGGKVGSTVGCVRPRVFKTHTKRQAEQSVPTIRRTPLHQRIDYFFFFFFFLGFSQSSNSGSFAPIPLADLQNAQKGKGFSELAEIPPPSTSGRLGG